MLWIQFESCLINFMATYVLVCYFMNHKTLDFFLHQSYLGSFDPFSYAGCYIHFSLLYHFSKKISSILIRMILLHDWTAFIDVSSTRYVELFVLNDL